MHSRTASDQISGLWQLLKRSLVRLSTSFVYTLQMNGAHRRANVCLRIHTHDKGELHVFFLRQDVAKLLK